MELSESEPCYFFVGQFVRLKTGKSPQRVIEIRWHSRKGWMLTCQYLSEVNSEYYRSPRDQHDFVAWNDQLEEFNTADERKQAMTDLYQVKDSGTPPRFGTKLAENSNGEFVLEMKGEGGKVEAFKTEVLEIVLPYTVQLVCVPPNESGMHIQAEPGKLNKGDLLIYEPNGKMFRVAAVDTKNRSPKCGSMIFFKLAGESMTIGNDN